MAKYCKLFSLSLILCIFLSSCDENSPRTQRYLSEDEYYDLTSSIENLEFPIDEYTLLEGYFYYGDNYTEDEVFEAFKAVKEYLDETDAVLIDSYRILTGKTGWW